MTLRKLFWFIIGSVILYPLLTTTGFVVDQRHYAIVYAMGEVKQIIAEPGLYFKLPSPVQSVVTLDRRMTTTESIESGGFVTSDKKNLVIENFVKWRIIDPRQHFVSFGGKGQQAHDRVMQIAKAALNEEVAKHTVTDLISGERSTWLPGVQQKIAAESKQFGIEVVDLRIKRIGYDEKATAAIYENMKTEQAKIAAEVRANGTAEAERIRADADKQRTVIVAEAYRDAQKLRGSGDAKSLQVYANAFGQNPEFARFYRTLEAYRASFSNRSDVLVVDPSSEFFRYMKNPKPAGAAK